MGLSSDDTRRREVVRDLAAGALLIGALFFPWNLYFGFRIPDSSKTVFGLLLAVTSLSLASLAVTFAGRRSQLRLGLNVPYLLLVLAFVVFDAIQTIRLGGTVHVPGGVGPGGWLGITGALLSAQPALTGATTDEGSHSRWLRATQFLGYASMLGAALSTGFNLSWRVRYALEPAAGASGFGKQNLAVIDTAVVYGVVALAAVLVASRWLLRPTAAEALSTVALGGSTLIAGSIVWSLPIGREIDAFHGIAQNTSTAGVGYEGYLVWAAAAAMCAPLTLFRSPNAPPIDKAVWRAASRNGLLLIAVWCLGSVAMRLTDLVVAVLLNYPFSRYDSMALAAFDLATAVLAIWLRGCRILLVRRLYPCPATLLAGDRQRSAVRLLVLGKLGVRGLRYRVRQRRRSQPGIRPGRDQSSIRLPSAAAGGAGRHRLGRPEHAEQSRDRTNLAALHHLADRGARTAAAPLAPTLAGGQRRRGPTAEQHHLHQLVSKCAGAASESSRAGSLREPTPRSAAIAYQRDVVHDVEVAQTLH